MVVNAIKNLTAELAHLFDLKSRGAFNERGYVPKSGLETQFGPGTPDTDSHSPELTSNKVAVSLLIDLSSSMRVGMRRDLDESLDRSAIGQTFTGLVILAESLNMLGIKTEILGFNQEFYEFKSFSETALTDQARGRMAKMIDYTQGFTYMGHALEGASDRLSRLSRKEAKEKIIIVLTDGAPTDYDNLERVINYVIPNRNQKVVGLGFGPLAVFIKDFFPNHLRVSTQQISEKLPMLLSDIIAVPNRL